MEIVLQILSIALVLFAFIGVLAMIAIVAGIMMVINGGEINIGYDENDNFNSEEDEKD